MNKIIQDYKDENFMRGEMLLYGIIAPFVVFVACFLAGAIE